MEIVIFSSFLEVRGHSCHVQVYLNIFFGRCLSVFEGVNVLKPIGVESFSVIVKIPASSLAFNDTKRVDMDVHWLFLELSSGVDI
jgi:hypothetical protein